MVFNHETITTKKGCYYLNKKVSFYANDIINKDILRKFWNSFSFGHSDIEFMQTDDLVFYTDIAKQVELGEYTYAINVETDGIFVKAKDEKGLISGFMTLIDLIKMDDDGNVKIDCCEIYESPYIKKRMIHFCVFPETEIWELKKFVRLCGALKYTHVVIEFWGMLKFDCLKELSWDNAFTKDMIRPIVKEANEMGIEIIPMFNHWGHAAQCRIIHGKHVVLDQNPKLQYLFDDTGWCWNFLSSKTKNLLKNIRYELIELCGDGSYFHIGCDEAEGFSYTKEKMDEVCEYINEVNADISSYGRKAIMWADMFLYKKPLYENENIYGGAPTEKAAEYMLDSVDKNIVMADWQYSCTKTPIETSILLKNAGFDVLICPWGRDFESDSVEVCLDTIKDYNVDGIMHTTWHTLSNGTMYVGKVAMESWTKSTKDTVPVYAAKTASIQRKVCFADGNYERSGWARLQISTRT